jgi:hypothetical protein
MTTHHRRSRRSHHRNNQTRANAVRTRNSITSFDPSGFVGLRLNLTDDGWYVGADEPETVENAHAAAGASAHRQMPRLTSPVLVIAIILNHDDAGQDAAQTAEAIYSTVRSLLGPDDYRLDLVVVGPGSDRNG